MVLKQSSYSARLLVYGCVYVPFFVYNSNMYSAFLQSSVLHSQPKSTVGTPAYIAPEVLLKKEYDGKVLLLFLYN